MRMPGTGDCPANSAGEEPPIRVSISPGQTVLARLASQLEEKSLRLPCARAGESAAAAAAGFPRLTVLVLSHSHAFSVTLRLLAVHLSLLSVPAKPALRLLPSSSPSLSPQPRTFLQLWRHSKEPSPSKSGSP